MIWRRSITPLLEELFHGQEDALDAFDYETFVVGRLGGGG